MREDLKSLLEEARSMRNTTRIFYILCFFLIGIPIYPIVSIVYWLKVRSIDWKTTLVNNNRFLLSGFISYFFGGCHYALCMLCLNLEIAYNMISICESSSTSNGKVEQKNKKEKIKEIREMQALGKISEEQAKNEIKKILSEEE